MTDAASGKPPKPKRKSLGKDIARVAGVVLFFAAVAYVLRLPAVAEVVDVGSLRDRVQNHGLRGVALFVLIAAAAHGIGIPRIWACAVAGAAYGAVMGAAVAQAGTVIGAVINFLVGRWVLRGPVKRRMPERLRPWFDRFAQDGFRWSFYVRLFPLSNATVMNLVCGASRMRFLDFVAGTALGYIPLTIAFALFGSAAAKQKGWQIALGAGLFALVLVGRWIYRRLRKDHTAPAFEAADDADSPAEATEGEAPPG